MLENEKPFDENKATLIRGFLEDCKPPICLVAHNGNNFDFPLLKEELVRFPSVRKNFLQMIKHYPRRKY